MSNPGKNLPEAPLGAVSPRALVDARLALHLAAQPLAATAYALLPMRDDHGHAVLFWSAARRGFVGRELGGGLRGFLDPEGSSVGLLRDDASEAGRIALSGLTLDEALGAFTDLLRSRDLEVPAEGLRLPEYDLPASTILAGAPFSAPDVAALAELSGWFGFGAPILDELAGSLLDGAEVRGWPHHFDLAALRTLDPDRDPEHARSVGVGFSPGDGSYPEPYFYVTPWPAPSPAELPELNGRARWHTDGFTSAILTASDVLADGVEETPATIRSCVETSFEILGA